MVVSREQLKIMYQDTAYWPRYYAKRPSGINIPLQLMEAFASTPLTEIQGHRHGDQIVIPLDKDDLTVIAPVLLHESLFNMYKAFYNYLAARNLLFGGMEHWIEITTYYCKFFLARSLTCLVGKQAYYLQKRDACFLPNIASGLATGRGRVPPAYRIRLDLDIPSSTGTIVFDTENVKSHKDVWKDYSDLDIDALGVHSLLLITQGETFEYLSKERNLENYSFNGYRQLDFNLDMGSFERCFERDPVKGKADRLYDPKTLEVLGAFCDQYQLIKSLGIKNLPIELEKFEHMITYCMFESKAREHLVRLCQEGFPHLEVYSEDGIDFTDSKGRSL